MTACFFVFHQSSKHIRVIQYSSISVLISDLTSASRYRFMVGMSAFSEKPKGSHGPMGSKAPGKSEMSTACKAEVLVVVVVVDDNNGAKAEDDPAKRERRAAVEVVVEVFIIVD